MVALIIQMHGTSSKYNRCNYKRWCSCQAIIAIIAIFFISGLSMAENLEYCYDHPLSKSEWSDNATFFKFNSSIGELTGAQVKMNFTLQSNFSLTNLGDYPANTTVHAKANLSLTLPGNDPLMMDAEVNKTLYINSNETLSSNESSNKLQTFDLSNLEGFIGSSSGETVILPLAVTTSSSVQLNGDIMTELRPLGAASVCIIYEFVPAKGEQINQS